MQEICSISMHVLFQQIIWLISLSSESLKSDHFQYLYNNIRFFNKINKNDFVCQEAGTLGRLNTVKIQLAGLLTMMGLFTGCSFGGHAFMIRNKYIRIMLTLWPAYRFFFTNRLLTPGGVLYFNLGINRKMGRIFSFRNQLLY